MALLSSGNKKPDNKHDVCFSYQQAGIKKNNWSSKVWLYWPYSVTVNITLSKCELLP